MRAHFGLPSVTAEDTEGKPPIQVKFEIPYFTTSGIQVRKLEGYFPEKGNIRPPIRILSLTINIDYLNHNKNSLNSFI